MDRLSWLTLSICVLVVWVTGLVARSRRLSGRNLPLPPGPRAWPLLGNLLDVPRVYPWLTYCHWAKKYGDVMSLNVMGKTIVILCSPEAIDDLFEKESAKFSDRPHSVVLNDLVGYSEIIALRGYDDIWRRQRRVFHQGFSLSMVENHQPMVLRESRSMLKELVKNPDRYNDHIRLMMGALTLGVTYGIRVSGATDKWITASESAVHNFMEASSPGAFLVEQLPILKYVPDGFPLAGWKKKIASYKENLRVVLDDPFEHAKREMARGEHGASVLSAVLNKVEGSKNQSEEECIAKNAAASAYIAGVDTTFIVAQVFLLAMVTHPEVQKKAQEELDRVIGRDRLPDLQDRPLLHYVNAVIKEALRWQPIVPLGLPHSSSVDGEYRGYFIPKGSVIIPNIWSVLHDPAVYPNPEEFKPERFLKDGILSLEGKDPVAAFGCGRRICPGRWFGDAMLYGVISHILSAFTILPPLDEHGNEAPVRVEMASSFVLAPVNFSCRFLPRSVNIEGVILASQDKS